MPRFQRSFARIVFLASVAALSAAPAQATKLNGYLFNELGPLNADTWILGIVNTGTSTADNVAIGSFTLAQSAGAACTPVISPPSSFPVSLGSIAPGVSDFSQFLIDFSSCLPAARFTLDASLTATGYTGEVTLTNLAMQGEGTVFGPQPPPADTPEPASLALALAGLVWWRARARRIGSASASPTRP